MFSTITNLIVAILPALVPWTSFFLHRVVDHSVSISRHSIDDNYDYIIVGAGSAGCTIASRLSEDPYTKVLLLEAGGSENTVSEIPQTIFYLQETPIDWHFRTVPQTKCCDGLINRQVHLAAGKALGGSSAINNMLYVRGNRYDFDGWESMGAYGWSYNEVLPYFIKAEDNRELDLAYNGYHGRGGPLTVQRSRWRSPLAKSFLEAGQRHGYPIVDYNGPSQFGFSLIQNTMRRNARCSAAKAYLYPARDRPNLHVLTFAYVTRILFNDNREAIGVMFDRFQEKNNKVYARKEVILTAGSLKTPQLLMLSGIGPRKHLQSLGIPILADLPVGNNLLDHIYPIGFNFLLDESLKSYPGEFWTHIVSRVNTPPNVIQYLTVGRGPITSNVGMDGVAFVRTKYADPKRKDRPDVQIILLSSCISSDGGQKYRRIIGMKENIWQQGFKPYVEKECFTMLPILLHPKSFGTVRLRSTNPYDHPLIDPRYLHHPDDLKVLTESLMMTYQIGTSEPFRREYNVRISPIPVAGCEQHQIFSYNYMKCLVKKLSVSLWHPVGTCKMGQPNDPTTVVDPYLRVKGVKRLRVADGSIMPTETSGNTNAPIIMIGEKAADLIKGIYRTPNINLKKYLMMNKF